MKINREWIQGKMYYSFFCPGCKELHYFTFATHKFNGDREKPTIYPNLANENCESSIKAGMITFFECKHELSHKTLCLPSII